MQSIIKMRHIAVSVLLCVRLMSDESSESDYCVQLTLTCLYNVCHDWAVRKPSQPGNVTCIHSVYLYNVCSDWAVSKPSQPSNVTCIHCVLYISEFYYRAASMQSGLSHEQNIRLSVCLSNT